MPIDFNNKTQQFHIHNEFISYIMYVLPNGELGHLYFGQRLPEGRDYTYQKTNMNHVLKAYTADDDSYLCLEDTLQELPVYGRGDYRGESLRIKYEDGSYINKFTYKEHYVYDGIKQHTLVSMPHVHDEKKCGMTTLEVILLDSYRQVEVSLFYILSAKTAAISRHMEIRNLSSARVVIEQCASLNLDLNEASYDLLQLDGAWSRERHPSIRTLDTGVTSFSSIRGSSSANHNPFFALLSEHVTEDLGDCIGIALIYSGNFNARIEINQYKQTRAQIGINENGFHWNLESGECFETPQAVVSFSQNGLNGLSQNMHRFIDYHILPTPKRDEPYVLINNWEATYFDFDEKKIVEIATEASQLGMDLFVLDDGWFVGRDSDRSALGDWFVNKDKLPEGLAGLSRKIKALGIDFGLWIEPEMTNIESILYKEHPDWVIHHPAYPMSVGRHQYVLDYSRVEVVDTIYERISACLVEGKVDYVKWDMNRLISEPYSSHLSPDQQGELFHRHILGVYDLYNRLVSAFPHILFESCASGGGRFDLGLLYFAPQTWTSDDTDPVERLYIQNGTSYLYPLATMGSHVAADINHQTLRKTSLSYRSDVALFGTYGYEMDVTLLSDDEKNIIKKQIIFFKKHWDLIHKGSFYRLESPVIPSKKNVNDLLSWMVVSEDKKQAMVGVYQILTKPSPNVQRIYLRGLDPKGEYIETATNSFYSGAELMTFGYVLDDFYTGIASDLHDKLGKSQQIFGHGDFTSKIIVLSMKEE